MIAFESSLSMLPHIKYILSEMTSPLLKELYEDLDTLEDLCTLIKDAIKEDPPLSSFASQSFPSDLAERSLSTSGLYPSRIIPPSFMASGGSSLIASLISVHTVSYTHLLYGLEIEAMTGHFSSFFACSNKVLICLTAFFC